MQLYWLALQNLTGYWAPPSLFSLAQKTGFDIESLIFSFAIEEPKMKRMINTTQSIIRSSILLKT
jgi:hypothetical protein